MLEIAGVTVHDELFKAIGCRELRIGKDKKAMTNTNLWGWLAQDLHHYMQLHCLKQKPGFS